MSNANPTPDTGPSRRSEKLPRLSLRVTTAAERQIRKGHPWLFDESVREVNRPGQLGELAVIYDKRDKFLAIGLYDPESPLRVRVLHAGGPVQIDHLFWVRRLLVAIEKRTSLAALATGYRLINGESDGWAGLVLDKYESTLVLKLYTGAWFQWLEKIVTVLRDELRPERIVLRLSRNIQAMAQERIGHLDGEIIHGKSLAGPVIFQESGLKFEADVLRGQKTGFFLDQRENRRLVGQFVQGGRTRDLLNAFSFSGAFSLYAAASGAQSVMDLDISAHAVESARRNFALNGDNPAVAACTHETAQADAFEWLAQSRQLFGLIVLDPPSLARRAADREQALEAYARLVKLAIPRLRSGGILVACSCSAHVKAEEFFAAVRHAAKQSRRIFRELMTTRQPLDHPASFPEAEYLKAIYLQL